MLHAIPRNVCRALGSGLLLQVRLDLFPHADDVDTAGLEAVSLDGVAYFSKAGFVGWEFHHGDRLGLLAAIGETVNHGCVATHSRVNRVTQGKRVDLGG